MTQHTLTVPHTARAPVFVRRGTLAHRSARPKTPGRHVARYPHEAVVATAGSLFATAALPRTVPRTTRLVAVGPRLGVVDADFGAAVGSLPANVADALRRHTEAVAGAAGLAEIGQGRLRAVVAGEPRLAHALPGGMGAGEHAVPVGGGAVVLALRLLGAKGMSEIVRGLS